MRKFVVDDKRECDVANDSTKVLKVRFVLWKVGPKQGTRRAFASARARHSRVLTDVPALIEGMASGSQSPKPKTKPS
jgi:hypothetical protein